MELLEKRTMKTTDPDKKVAEIGLTVADLFTIPLVTDCIFHHLEHSDLLSCSLLSQSWNSQARDYLRRQRTNLLKCKIDDQADSLQKLLDHLSDDNNLSYRQLFTGVHVRVEGIEAEKFDVEDANACQGTTRTQLTKIFKLFPMKHLIVTFEGYRYRHVPVIYFTLEFIFPLVPECQVKTVKITGLVLKYSAELLWARLPIRGSPKLKTVQMGCRDFDLPLETKPLVKESRRRAIIEMIWKEEQGRQSDELKRICYLTQLAHLKEMSKIIKRISGQSREDIHSKIAHLTSKLQALTEPET